MFGRNLEDLIRDTASDRSFDEEFFDFTDRLYPWTTVYRFFFLTDLVDKTQLMIGVGQKKVSPYWINGVETEFSSNGSQCKVGLSFWCQKESLIHKTRNEVLDLRGGMRSQSFRFISADKGYLLALKDLDTEVFLDDSASKTDYVRFHAGISPFYRHNKYLPFTGRIMGEPVEKGFAFVQKVNLNMPFIPWRWGRVFFEGGAQLDFYEPRIILPLYKSINFEIDGERMEFRLDQEISLRDGLWVISGTTQEGESLTARISSYSRVAHSFETKRSTFIYNEMPSKLEYLSIRKNGSELYSHRTLGESVANCEDAYYARIGL
ncbi:MAG: hypothetical protein D6733_02165 [Methanobacteriota archaeon]|nr:MAG: hypothetical protein D6733_02165 [Euryarchaeota archaeon]